MQAAEQSRGQSSRGIQAISIQLDANAKCEQACANASRDSYKIKWAQTLTKNIECKTVLLLVMS
eukprot:21437-Heterococcus_DN1.PRE.2